MLLREDDRAVIEQINGTVVKTFKPGYHLDCHPRIGVFRPDWLHHVNKFSDEYAHFPKVLELSPERLVTEYVPGNTIRTQRTQSWRHDLDTQRRFFLRMQRLYHQFVANLLQYNHDNGVYMVHSDLNLSNMFIINNEDSKFSNRVVCIDIDSVRINHTYTEHNWLNIPNAMMQVTSDELNMHNHRETTQALEDRVKQLKRP